MNSFREWLSDNLRYLLLLFGMAAGVLLIILGVRTYKVLEMQRAGRTVNAAQVQTGSETRLGGTNTAPAGNGGSEEAAAGTLAEKRKNIPLVKSIL